MYKGGNKTKNISDGLSFKNTAAEIFAAARKRPHGSVFSARDN